MAEKYARVAFIQRDIPKAYELTSGDKTRFTAADLDSAIQKMHPDGIFPSSIEAYAWEKVPTRRMIYVYIEGQSPKGPIYYRLTANGDAEAGYLISEAFTQPDKFKGSPLSETLERRDQPATNGRLLPTPKPLRH